MTVGKYAQFTTSESMAVNMKQQTEMWAIEKAIEVARENMQMPPSIYQSTEINRQRSQIASEPVSTLKSKVQWKGKTK